MDAKALQRIAEFRSKTPVAEKTTYLNLSFQPPMNEIVAKSITDYTDSGLHDINPKPKFVEKAEQARSLVGQYLGTDSRNIVFTRDTTDSLNIFIRSLKWEKGDNVVLLDSEHPNQGYAWLALQTEGLEVKLVRTNHEDAATADSFKPYVDEKTKFIGISSVMFHSGVKNDVAGICLYFRPKGIVVLVDGTQEVGLNVVDVKLVGMSAYVFSVHKGLNCPTGLGCLYIEPETFTTLKEVPPFSGGGAISNLNSDLSINADVKYHDSPLKYEHLNKPVLQALCLKDYLEFLFSLGIANVEVYLRELSTYLRDSLTKAGIPYVGGDDAKYRSSHSTVLALTNPQWFDALTKKNITTSLYRKGIRVSLGLYNNKGDIDRLVQVLADELAKGTSFS